MTRLLAASLVLLAYTFVGYPLALGLAARLRPRLARTDPAFRPSLSVVVAAYDEEATIGRRIENLLELGYPPDRLEVIVVADGSDDGTAERAAAFDGVRVLHDAARRGKMAALNRGAAAAGGDVICFTDANNLFAAGTLGALTAPFADPEVGVVAGRKAISDDLGRPLDRAEGLYWRYEARVKAWESAFGSAAGVSGEILALRREAFRPGPEDALVDDYELALQAAEDGWRIVYAHDAVSLEPASASVGDEAARRARIFTGLCQAVWRHVPRLLRRDPVLAWQVVSHKGLRPVVPLMLLGAAVGGVASSARSRWALAATAVQALFYGAALRGWLDEARGRERSPFFAPYYFVQLNVAALRGLIRFLTRSQTGVWEKVRRV
jgi:cellulose synthase/poly-beta-1,6-N-acetylglucosamine synthase-like glycosyltransferase